MIIGTVIAQIHIPGCSNRKQRRSIVKSITTRIANKYNVSIAELNDENALDMVTLGIASIAISKIRCLSETQAALNLIEESFLGEIEIININTEIFTGLT